MSTLWSRRGTWMGPAVIVFVVVIIAASLFSPQKDMADTMIVDASVACSPRIERLATHDFQWTDWGTPTLRTGRPSANPEVVTYVGDKIKFQNGFGAWAYYTCECDFNTTNKSVVDVRATPGRLMN
jgi:hypothetical protein